MSYVARAVRAQSASILSAKKDRVVLRVRGSSFGDSVIKIASAENPLTLHAVYSEAASLTYLAAHDCRSVPTLLGVESNPKGFVSLIRSDVRGLSLHDKMREAVLRGLWPSQRHLAEFAVALGESVADIHRCGSIHGDLKPANVISDWKDEASFRIRGLPSLIDLESAQLCDQRLTWGSRSGTWGFIAPERYVRIAPLKQSDVFSLSAITWFLFVGRVGFYGTSASSRVPTEIRSYLRTGLDIDYRKRPSDAREWVEGLRAAVDRSLVAEKSTIHDLADWPDDWRPEYDSLLTQTFERAIALAYFRRNSLLPEDFDTMSRDAISAVGRQANNEVFGVFESYLEGDGPLADYAKSIGRSEGALRQELKDLYDEVSEAVRELSKTHAASQLPA